MLARCLAAGVACGAVLGLLAGPGTDTGTGFALVAFGALLGGGLGGLVAVVLDVADVSWPQRAAAGGPSGGRVVAISEPDPDDGPLVPAGWYPNPAGGPDRRYWDGTTWR